MSRILNRLTKTALSVILFASSLICNAQYLPQPTTHHNLTITEQLENNPLFNPYAIINKLLNFALSHQGIPYKYGAIGPNRFDCSGFTSYVFNRHGYKLNRTAAGQYRNGTTISQGNEQSGDLVFFSARRNYKRIGHVGIVVARNEVGFDFIHASCSRGITISRSDERYYKIQYKGARRIINNPPAPYILIQD